MHLVFSLLALFLACSLAACDGSGQSPPISYCGSSADCPPGDVCLFSGGGSCAGGGQCGAVPAAAIATCDAEPVCSCGGVTQASCVVDGYATSPVKGLGACPDGG